MKGYYLNKKGFTLLEIAIVMVVIGILMGAILKGQDLIFSARAKALVSSVKKWHLAIYTFYDRKGRFPGDACKDGIIEDNYPAYNPCGTNELTQPNTAIAEILKSGLTDTPRNPITLGGTSFWVYIGHDHNVGSTTVVPPSSTGGRKANVIVLCCNSQCGQSWAPGNFSSDQITLLQYLDTHIDGLADAGRGHIRAVSSIWFAGGGDWGLIQGRYNGRVTDVGAVDETPQGSSMAWTTTYCAAVWLFEGSY